MGSETLLFTAFVFNRLEAPKTPRGRTGTFGNISAVCRSLRAYRQHRSRDTSCAALDLQKKWPHERALLKCGTVDRQPPDYANATGGTPAFRFPAAEWVERELG